MAWENLTDAQNEAQTAAIYAVIAKNGGDVKAITYSPSRVALTSVIEYPDQRSSMNTVAEILALGTLEFVEIEPQWDVAEFTGLVGRAAQA
ncbi:MAG: hypothetical protein ACLPYY_14740 [Acidimicrobiales bacterium]